MAEDRATIRDILNEERKIGQPVSIPGISTGFRQAAVASPPEPVAPPVMTSGTEEEARLFRQLNPGAVSQATGGLRQTEPREPISGAPQTAVPIAPQVSGFRRDVGDVQPGRVGTDSQEALGGPPRDLQSYWSGVGTKVFEYWDPETQQIKTLTSMGQYGGPKTFEQYLDYSKTTSDIGKAAAETARTEAMTEAIPKELGLRRQMLPMDIPTGLDVYGQPTTRPGFYDVQAGQVVDPLTGGMRRGADLQSKFAALPEDTKSVVRKYFEGREDVTPEDISEYIDRLSR